VINVWGLRAAVGWPLICSIQIWDSWFWNPDTGTSRETHRSALRRESAPDQIFLVLPEWLICVPLDFSNRLTSEVP